MSSTVTVVVRWIVFVETYKDRRIENRHKVRKEIHKVLMSVIVVTVTVLPPTGRRLFDSVVIYDFVIKYDDGHVGMHTTKRERESDAGGIPFR